MHRNYEHHFEWDPLKARKNFRKHGITFERAASVFMDPMAMSILDDRSSQKEDRWITMGMDRSGILLLVCHAHRQEHEDTSQIRIISARKATKNEVRQYMEP